MTDHKKKLIISTGHNFFIVSAVYSDLARTNLNDLAN